MNKELIEQIHEHWSNQSNAVTHSEDCWRWHPGCAIELLYKTIKQDYEIINGIHMYIDNICLENNLLKLIKQEIEQIHPELGDKK